MDQGWLYHYNNCFHFFFLKNKGEKKDVVFVLREVATSCDDAIEELTLTRIIWQDTNHVQPPIVRDQELILLDALDLMFWDGISLLALLLANQLLAISCVMRSCRLQFLWAFPASKIGEWCVCACSLLRCRVTPSPVQRSQRVLHRPRPDRRKASAANATSRPHHLQVLPQPPCV